LSAKTQQCLDSEAQKKRAIRKEKMSSQE